MNEKQPFKQETMEAILRSDEAKKLLQLLRKDGGRELKTASEVLKKGEYSKALSILKPLLKTPDAEALLQSINQELGRNQ